MSLFRILTTTLLALLVWGSAQAVDSRYLADSAQPAGTILSAGDTATAYQATTEALHTLAVLGETPAAVDSGLAWLAETAPETTESLARRVTVSALHGIALAGDADALLAHQNRDGGFGALPGFGSTSWDTAIALNALGMADLTGEPEAVAAMQYLLAQQSAAGGWPLGVQVDHPYTTARALHALWYFRHRYAITEPLERAKTLLLAQRQADGQWQEVPLTALALEAVLPLLPTLAPVVDGIEALQAAQQADGSWGGDVYATALALRAIHDSKIESNPTDPGSIIPNPDLGVIRGRVVDADSGAPLSGVAVVLSGTAAATVTTDTNGQFFFSGLDAGAYLLSLTVEGYGSFSSPVGLTSGAQVDLGDIALAQAITHTTGTIRGRVTQASTGAALASVTIKANGLTTTTNSNGEYQINDVPPGTVTLSASRSGYTTVSATAEVTAGGIVVFSPQLTYAGWPSLHGTITDAITGDPIAGVQVALSGANSKTATTSSSGAYSLSSLNEGATTITVTYAGYLELQVTLEMVAGQSYTFSPVLTPITASGVVLQGTVVDAATGDPINGAAIVLGGVNDATVQTDLAGHYRFEGLVAGETTISVVADGYGEVLLTATLLDGRENYLPITLLAEGDVLPTTEVSGRVVQSGSAMPVPGAVVEAIQGEVVVSAIADLDGNFTLEGVTGGVWRLDVRRSGFIAFTTEFVVPYALPPVLLGDITMEAVGRFPDLVPYGVDRSGATSDPATFRFSGTLNITIANLGEAATQRGFNVDLYLDSNGDGIYQADGDRLVATTRVDETLEPEAILRATLAVDTELPFRDAPLMVWLDSGGEIPELVEENNQAPTSELTGCGP